ncbi:NADH dehydrogenase [ubiquinone] 1 alpha subcomplex subunit 3 isoform X4 [Macaca fascicularis]|uniref:NADH dehydrogenase [ubiquinone] 1 alpha subcomplex subunit 3 isoform X4 n=1 Tax=Macaca mulatta TaxID=9544 RepID=UPI000D30E2BC|nr:NADH dehydrogenase [ubiquinone] 1 alpha subcomplex subunit 3 isoform X2 [Macaca nemestrina]XP_028695123.1 NADH dehydrogenase [ubiquinone] 1 alpha subcomplex subunit 3 isoform X4 [Macaca mulatta]
MAARLGAFLKNAWDKEPVLVASFVIGGLAIIMPTFSPYVKYSIMINEATPYNYPGLWRHAGLSGPPPVPQCPSVMMGTCRTCPATPRTLRAPAWSGLRNCEHLH